MRKCILTLLLISLLNCIAQESTNTVLLFSFFRKNGEDGLYLALSKDGLKWEELKPRGSSFLKPEVGGKLMRDPCICQGADERFHLVWTTGWGKPPVIGYAWSSNLIDWSEQKAIPVMSNEPNTRNVWAPELFYDKHKKQFLIFWASTIPGKFPETADTGDDGYNHRIYYTTTKDFQDFTPTKLFYDGGFNVIDATLLENNGKYYLIVKDETLKPVKKNLRIAVSDSPEGPFGKAGEPFTISWVEGPSAIKIGDEFFVYFDHYVNPQYYGAVKSKDMKVWEDISKQLVFPKGAKHGTVLHIPEKIVKNIINEL